MNTYLFDFDGTLVDSMPTFVSTMLRILDENGIAYGDDIIKIITPLGLDGTASYFVSLGVPKSKEAIMQTMADYMMEQYLHHIPAKPYVEQTLKDLKEKGCSLNVLTASPHITLDPCLKRLGLWELFDNVWSCDDFATTKANPDIYRQVAQRLGKPVDQVLFVDDNIHAISTAKQASMLTCGIFDPSSAEDKEKMQALANHYAMDLRDVCAYHP